MTTATKGASPRQARIIDWMKHPTGVPQGPAIDYTMAWWTAQELIDLAGLDCSRAACLADLNALRRRGVVEGVAGRWRYVHVWETR